MGDDLVNALEKRLDDMQAFNEKQFGFGRDHFKRLEEKVDSASKRITVLETAKARFEGIKTGFVMAIALGVSAVIGAAVLIIDKLKTVGP